MEAGRDEPGRDAVYPDPQRTDFFREAARVGDQRALGCAVVRGSGAATVVTGE